MARSAAGLLAYAVDLLAAGFDVDKDIGLQPHSGDAATLPLACAGLSIVALLRITANYCKPGFAVMPVDMVLE